jgi:hypothetical protein
VSVDLTPAQERAERVAELARKVRANREGQDAAIPSRRQSPKPWPRPGNRRDDEQAAPAPDAQTPANDSFQERLAKARTGQAASGSATSDAVEKLRRARAAGDRDCSLA